MHGLLIAFPTVALGELQMSIKAALLRDLISQFAVGGQSVC